MIQPSGGLNAIVSTFSDVDTQWINAIYDELREADLSIPRFVNFIPHLSYTAINYSDPSPVETTLREMALQIPPLTVKTNGLGIFTGDLLVVYIHIVRTPTLNRLQSELSEALSPFATEVNQNFLPTAWSPHLTIAWPKDAASLGEAVRLLSQRDLHHEILIDNFTILFNNETTAPQRFELEG